MEKICFALAVLIAAGPCAFAQDKDYPNRPIRLIVPFGPGSATDVSGRFIAQALGSVLGQPVIIENRPGADGAIGILAAKNAPADGYTIVQAGWTNLTVNPVVMKDLPYDPVKDFRPIAGVTRTMLGIVVAGDSKLNSLAELIAAAKQDQNRLDFGTFSAGYRLGIEWFASAAGVKIVNVPYKATTQIHLDVMSHRIFGTIDAMSTLGPLVKSGKLKVLAVTGENRLSDFPGVPTMQESGFPDYTMYGWSAIYTRSETPEDAVDRLVGAMQKVLRSDATREFASRRGSELNLRLPPALRKFQADELANFRRVAQVAGIAAK
ncbi:MAG: tripartite tricarboxylate transporter substrate binding protein [Burkholderiales bacterium]|nr:tripartite tricarboxylate transporter substrate binding protein [Burkholderiales bacterium]